MKRKKRKFYTVLGYDFKSREKAKEWCIFNMKNNHAAMMTEFTEDGEVTKIYKVEKRNWKVFIKKTKDYEKEYVEQQKKMQKKLW